MANIFEFLSKDGNITPEKARKSRQMQFHDKIAYVWGLRYRWDPSLLMNPVRRFAHFMLHCLQQSHTSTNTRYTHSLLLDWSPTRNIVGHANHFANPSSRFKPLSTARCYTTGWNNRACQDLKPSKKFPSNPWSYTACGSSRSDSG